MRIGIDATSWSNWRGFGRYTRSLVKAIVAFDSSHEYVLFFDSSYARCRGVPPGARHVVVPTVVAQDEALSVDGRRTVTDMRRLATAIGRAGLDVFFCPSVDSYVPVPGASRVVVAVHDTIPEEYGPLMLPSAPARWRRRLKVAVALTQADRVVTGSPYMRRAVTRVFGLRPERVDVIPYGAEAIFRPAEDPSAVRRRVAAGCGFSAPYLLHVGGFGPNKNLVRLVTAFGRLAEREGAADAHLVFVGRRDDDAVYAEHAALDAAVAATGRARRIHFLGHQPDDRLCELYQAAAAVVVPSLSEGYGLPALESVRCGTPAVVTRVSPLPELLGDAALPVDPLDDTALGEALAAVLADTRKLGCLRSAAVAHAGRFTWEEAARTALPILTGQGPDGAR